MTPAKVRRPGHGPTPDQVTDRERWEALTSTSLAATQAAAEKWRTGLATFVTLVTGGLLVKGPQSASDLTTGWRVVLTVLTAGGLGAAAVSLWLALRAAAGAPGRVSYPEVVRAHGGVRQFEIACATRASDLLQRAKLTMACSLALLAVAAFSWWWAPVQQAAPVVRITLDTGTVCGQLLSADTQRFRVQVDGESDPRVVAFADARNVRVAPSC